MQANQTDRQDQICRPNKQAMQADRKQAMQADQNRQTRPDRQTKQTGHAGRPDRQIRPDRQTKQTGHAGRPNGQTRPDRQTKLIGHSGRPDRQTDKTRQTDQTNRRVQTHVAEYHTMQRAREWIETIGPKRPFIPLWERLTESSMKR